MEVRSSAAEFTCDRCGACCRTHRVPVTHADVARLAADASEDAASFLAWLAPDEVDMEGEPDSFVELSVGRRLLVLAQKSAGPERADCIFWRENEGCSVYPRRPAACRTYPFEPEAVPATGRMHLRIHPDVVCDASTGAFSFEARRAEAADDDATRAVLASYDTRQRELSAYVERVAAWNRRQRRRRLAGHRPESGEAFLTSVLQGPERGSSEPDGAER